jgi:hypothetical protein
MSQNAEAQTIAEIMDRTRKLSRFYLKHLREVDPLKQIDVNGEKLNCVLWLCAHMTWAEHGMCVTSMGAPSMDIAWMKHFEIGSSSDPRPEWPTMEQVVADMKHVHERALETMRALSDLDALADGSFFGRSSTRRDILMHAIRHEGTHAGHLGWLCKLNGIKTI